MGFLTTMVSGEVEHGVDRVIVQQVSMCGVIMHGMYGQKLENIVLLLMGNMTINLRHFLVIEIVHDMGFLTTMVSGEVEHGVVKKICLLDIGHGLLHPGIFGPNLRIVYVDRFIIQKVYDGKLLIHDEMLKKLVLFL